MPEKQLFTPQETRFLALALIQVLQMWSNERYGPFLLRSTPGKLTEEWFRWFVGSWNVARTIKDGRQGRVREYLDQAVDNLPTSLKVVFVLRDIEGLSTRETANVLEISETAVKTRLSRARLRLREELTTYFSERVEGQLDGTQ